jgi:hypothetical protein
MRRAGVHIPHRHKPAARAIGPDERKAQRLTIDAHLLESRAARLRQANDGEEAARLQAEADDLKAHARQILNAAQQRENEAAALVRREPFTLGK